MVFEAEANGRYIVRGLVWSPEIVLHELFGKLLSERHSVNSHVAKADEFILKGAIEPLIDRIVLGVRTLDQ